MMPHVKFPSIESFAHVWRSMNRRFDPTPTVFGAKIKLHGTNGGVRVNNDGTVVAQSRSRDLTPEDDNAGFAAWVAQTADAWSLDPRVFIDISHITYFGEWAGKGIQKNDAVTRLDDKYFFVFAIQIDDRVYTDPNYIETAIPDLDHVIVLPWYNHELTAVYWTNAALTNLWIDRLNEEVDRIGACDPFIKDLFDIEGPGEGLVLMPFAGIETHGMERDEFAHLTFKAKSEAHRVKKMGSAVSKRVEVPVGVHEFVDMFATEARFEQGLMEACDGIAEKPRTADFLKWVGNDIIKESEVERAEAGLEWKDLAKHVNQVAVRWFHAKCAQPFGEAA